MTPRTPARARARLRLAQIVAFAALASVVAPGIASAAVLVPTTPPSVSGTASEGATLTIEPGTWPGATPTYAYRWQRCDLAGDTCTTIAGQSRVTYVTTSADVNRTIRAEVTATSADGAGTARTGATDPITGFAPSNTGPPVITGALRTGLTVGTTVGTWLGTTPLTFAYQWLRCDVADVVCTPITGATAATYAIAPADEGLRLKVRVTATNPVSDTATFSDSTAAVAPAAPPVNTEAPTLTGDARDGQVLTVHTGSWTGATPLTYAFRWLRCSALTGCTQLLLPATTVAYTLTPSDVGFRMRAEVVATNPDAVVTASTAESTAVTVEPPRATVLPVVTGPLRAGQVLRGADGTWVGTPTIGFTYAWRRCTPACTAIPGATGLTYTLTAGDVGAAIVLRVIGENAAGAVAADSAATATIGPPAPPVNTALPSVSGSFRENGMATVSTGAWSGVTPMLFSYDWERCTVDGCLLIPGATSASYRFSVNDVGATVRVRVTAANADGERGVLSTPSPVVAAIPPTTTREPALTGVTRDGETLTVTPGTWGGSQPVEFAYAWRRCDATGAACTAIAGANASTYVLSGLDVARRIRVRVTGSNAGGSLTVESAASTAVTGNPPVNSTLPVVTGVPRDGEVLTGTAGAWTGTAVLNHSYQWQRCGSSGAACVPIPAATSATYRLTTDDYDRTIRLRVTATNGFGSLGADSALTARVVAMPLSMVVRPSVTGVRADGATLTAVPGVWLGTGPLTFAYEWQRFDALLDEWRAVTGATAGTYVLSGADVGQSLRVRVTANNPAGRPVVAFSPDAYDVVPVEPAVTALPTVTGSARDGQLLTGLPGDWSGTLPQHRAYQWLRCNAAGNGCVAIPGAAQNTYRLSGADVAHTFRIRVTSTNAAHVPVTAQSARTATILPSFPANLTAPAVLGLPRDGRTLNAEPGDWTGTPAISFTYRWERCTTGPAPDCTPIAGADGPAYDLRTPDVGFLIRVEVTAVNDAGSETAHSPPTTVVLPNPPVNVQPPVITGVPLDGETLTAGHGDWTGVIAFTHDFRWYRCDAAGATCGFVSGATGSTFRITPAEVGYRMRVEVIARNAGGSASAVSALTRVATAAPPVMLTRPTIAGRRGVGETLTAGDGTWMGSAPLRFTRQWLRCDTAAGACVAIAAATAPTYRLSAADLGHRIRVRVLADNDAPGDGTSANSYGTLVVSDARPVNTAAPQIEASPVAQGVALTARAGAWTGASPMTRNLQWRRCSAAGDACEDIAGATTRNYTPGAADLGLRLRVTVSIDNGIGATSATSASVGPVKPAPPVNTVAPTLRTGAALVPGAELTAADGTWTGGLPLTFGYTWLRCTDAAGTDCATIPGAGSSRYVLVDDDIGRTIRVRVTATNSTTSTIADSEPTATVNPLPPALSTEVSITLVGPDGIEPRVGVEAVGDRGTWTGTGPITYTYQWQRCASTSDCADIAGATGPRHTMTEADAGRRLRFVATAHNAVGPVSAASVPTAVVAGTPPAATTPPAVVVPPGVPLREGVVLSAEGGTWTGTGPIDLRYQWRRCPAGGGACTPIPGATTPTYTATGADVGSKLSVSVVAESTAGTADAESPPTDVINGIPPEATVLPAIGHPAGAIRAGTRLLGTSGTWTGSKPTVYAYQWLRCDAAGAGCRPIATATTSAYVLLAADLGAPGDSGTVRVVVTASNPGSSVSATSEALAWTLEVPAPKPAPVPKPAATPAPKPAPKPAAKPAPKPAPKPAATPVPKPGATAPRLASATTDAKGRYLILRVKCPMGTEACAGKLAFQAKGLKRRVSFKLKPEKSRRFKLKLKAAERKLLAGAEGISGSLKVTLKGKPPETSTVTVKRPVKKPATGEPKPGAKTLAETPAKTP